MINKLRKPGITLTLDANGHVTGAELCRGASDADFRLLAHLPALETLSVRVWPREESPTTRGVLGFAGLPRLKRLNLTILKGVLTTHNLLADVQSKMPGGKLFWLEIG